MASRGVSDSVSATARLGTFDQSRQTDMLLALQPVHGNQFVQRVLVKRGGPRRRRHRASDPGPLLGATVPPRAAVPAREG